MTHSNTKVEPFGCDVKLKQRVDWAQLLKAFDLGFRVGWVHFALSVVIKLHSLSEKRSSKPKKDFQQRAHLPPDGSVPQYDESIFDEIPFINVFWLSAPGTKIAKS